MYQVAHEAVHCLNPILLGQSTYLEEGLATHFAHQYTNKYFGIMNIGSPKYLKAANLAQSLLEYKPTIIKELREIEPSISLFTKEMIVSRFPGLEKIAIQLTTNFQQEL